MPAFTSGGSRSLRSSTPHSHVRKARSCASYVGVEVTHSHRGTAGGIARGMPLYAQSDAAARRRLAYAPVEVPRAAVPARASRNAHVQPARRAGASPTRAVVRESRLHEALAVREDPAVLRTPLRMYVRDAAQAGSKASPERLSPASSSDVFNRRSMGEAAGDDVDELPDSRVTVIDRSAVNLQPPPVSIETMAALVPSAPPPRVVDAADVQTHQVRTDGAGRGGAGV